jgi:hypothetical protein
MYSRTSLSRTRRDHPKILEFSEVRLIRDRLWRQLFIDKGSDVCFHHVWKCVEYIFDCHVYRLRSVRYVLDVFVCFNERINKEISIHKTFIYYSINLIFNKNECELFKRNKKKRYHQLLSITMVIKLKENRSPVIVSFVNYNLLNQC